MDFGFFNRYAVKKLKEKKKTKRTNENARNEHHQQKNNIWNLKIRLTKVMVDWFGWNYPPTEYNYKMWTKYTKLNDYLKTMKNEQKQAKLRGTLWRLIVCVNLTELRNARIAGKTFLSMSLRVFLEDISIESVDWVNKITFTNVGGHHQIH